MPSLATVGGCVLESSLQKGTYRVARCRPTVSTTAPSMTCEAEKGEAGFNDGWGEVSRQRGQHFGPVGQHPVALCGLDTYAPNEVININ